MTDPRAAVEFRLPAVELKKGDLVNTTPGEDDWQQVVGVYLKSDDAKSTEIRTLVSSLGGRYVVVQLTDLAPDALWLVCWSFILMPIALWFFGLAVRRSKIDGTLGLY